MTPEPSRPFWNFRDIAVFLGVALPSLMAANLIVKGVWWLAGGEPARKAFVDAPAQVLGYLLMFTLLAVWFRIEHGRPLWESLKGEPSLVSFPAAAFNGLATAVTVALIGALIQIPRGPTPMQELLNDRASLLFMFAIGVTIGPTAEELIFRGLIQPVIAARFGTAPGILIPAVGFGLIHLPQYGGSWKHALMIALAGASFGWMRHASRSTAASIVAHSAYNSLLFVGYLAAGKDAPP